MVISFSWGKAYCRSKCNICRINLLFIYLLIVGLTGSTCGNHFCRNIFALQIRMMNQKSINSCFYLRKIFLISNSLIATG